MVEAAQAAFPGRTFAQDSAGEHPERYRAAEIHVWVDPPGKWVPFAHESKALKGLEEMWQMRLYCDVRGSDRARREVRNFCEAWLAREAT